VDLEGSGEVPRRDDSALCLRTEGVGHRFLQGGASRTMGVSAPARVAAAPTRVPADDRGLPSGGK